MIVEDALEGTSANIRTETFGQILVTRNDELNLTKINSSNHLYG